ncbi:MAG: PilZ domain-containing protein [Pyrinomonadaceae bacterium]
MVKNRRIEERVSLNLPARWDGVSGTHEGRIEDLSLGGCFVNTAGRVDVGEIVGIEIRLPSELWLKLRGEVTSYQIGIGFGVLFSFLTSEEEQALRDLIIWQRREVPRSPKARH